MTKSSKTIQEKITALQELTAWFESDEFELKRALDVFKKAEELAAEIETDLKQLKNDVQVVAKKFEA